MWLMSHRQSATSLTVRNSRQIHVLLAMGMMCQLLRSFEDLCVPKSCYSISLAAVQSKTAGLVAHQCPPAAVLAAQGHYMNAWVRRHGGDRQGRAHPAAQRVQQDPGKGALLADGKRLGRQSVRCMPEHPMQCGNLPLWAVGFDDDMSCTAK